LSDVSGHEDPSIGYTGNLSGGLRGEPSREFRGLMNEWLGASGEAISSASLVASRMSRKSVSKSGIMTAAPSRSKVTVWRAVALVMIAVIFLAFSYGLFQIMPAIGFPEFWEIVISLGLLWLGFLAIAYMILEPPVPR